MRKSINKKLNKNLKNINNLELKNFLRTCRQKILKNKTKNKIKLKNFTQFL